VAWGGAERPGSRWIFKGSYVPITCQLTVRHAQAFSADGLPEFESASPVAPALLGSHLVDRLMEAGGRRDTASTTTFNRPQGPTSRPLDRPPQLRADFVHGLTERFRGGWIGLCIWPVRPRRCTTSTIRSRRQNPSFLGAPYQMLGLARRVGGRLLDGQRPAKCMASGGHSPSRDYRGSVNTHGIRAATTRVAGRRNPLLRLPANDARRSASPGSSNTYGHACWRTTGGGEQLHRPARCGANLLPLTIFKARQARPRSFSAVVDISSKG